MKEYCPIFAGSTYRCQCKGHSLDAPVPQQDLFEIKVSCSTPHGIFLKKCRALLSASTWIIVTTWGVVLRALRGSQQASQFSGHLVEEVSNTFITQLFEDMSVTVSS